MPRTIPSSSEPLQLSDTLFIKLRCDPSAYWSMSNNILLGYTFPQWLSVLRDNFTLIDYHRLFVLLRLVVVTLFSIFNSVVSMFDTLKYHRRISSTAVSPRPLFVLGQPRSGTTLLHNLLARHPDYIAPDIFQVAFPCSFLSSRCLTHQYYFQRLLTPTRPMDNIPQCWQSPCEDELATAAMSGGISDYLTLCFLRNWDKFVPHFVTLENVVDASFHRWKNAFMYFCRKLQFKGGNSRRLLLKSPSHTARVKTLLSLFDNPQFVYIHRNPYEVFQSSVHLVEAQFPYCALQQMDSQSAQDYIIRLHQTLVDSYLEDRRLLSGDQICEISFVELTRDPANTLRRIYKELNIDVPVEVVEQHIDMTGSVRNFQKNTHPPLSEAAKRFVHSKWKRSFDEFGYDQ